MRFTHCVARQPERVRDYADRQGLTICSDLPQALAQPGVLAVVLTTPHSLHTGQVIAATGAGRAVFCEKPLALSTADAARAIAACRGAGVPLGLGHDKRFFASMQALAQRVAGGELGEILYIEGHFSNETTRRLHSGWREAAAESPGGGLTATGVHIIDAFVNLVGPARRVQAHLTRHPPEPEPVDALSLFIEFERGISGTLSCIRSTPYFWRVQVFGKRGSAEALGPTELVVRMSDAPPQRFAFEPVDTLRHEMDAFADAVSGIAPYPITPEQMLADVALLEAAVESIAAGASAMVKTAVDRL